MPRLPKGKKYSNPRISFDGKFWYLSVGYEIAEKQEPLNDVCIGIDLGVKDLAVCSDGTNESSRHIKMCGKIGHGDIGSHNREI